MSKYFNTIGLIARQTQSDIRSTAVALLDYFDARHCSAILEEETAELLNLPPRVPIHTRDQLVKNCDLLLVIGGDGSLLNAARLAVDHTLPILGINRGRLGFLTDIPPSEFEQKLDQIIQGHYYEEQRFFLTAEIRLNNTILAHDVALNEIVLMPGHVSRLIEFSIHIDEHFVCSQRADGLITATPTGSTAYALSGGGPIIHPQLSAIVLVPMFPHTLTARPIVVSADSRISIRISDSNQSAPRLSCDGQARVIVPFHAEIIIAKKTQTLRLIHPTDYNYFETLRTKLHWSAHNVS